jgi:DNA recombination protein RmuC
MFVPSDGIYHAALSEDPALIEYGVEQQVLLATPTTLIGLLRAVHYGWKQELIAESAREIAETGRELHRRIGRFVEPLARVGRQLGSAVSAYNEAVGSFESRVIPQLRRIEEAGAASEREIELAGIEEAPRALTVALELADDDPELPGAGESPTVADLRAKPAQGELRRPRRLG